MSSRASVSSRAPKNFGRDGFGRLKRKQLQQNLRNKRRTEAMTQMLLSTGIAGQKSPVTIGLLGSSEATGSMKRRILDHTLVKNEGMYYHGNMSGQIGQQKLEKIYETSSGMYGVSLPIATTIGNKEFFFQMLELEEHENFEQEYLVTFGLVSDIVVWVLDPKLDDPEYVRSVEERISQFRSFSSAHHCLVLQFPVIDAPAKKSTRKFIQTQSSNLNRLSKDLFGSSKNFRIFHFFESEKEEQKNKTNLAKFFQYVVNISTPLPGDWRSERNYFLAQDCVYEPYENDSKGRLLITGYLKGRNEFDVRGLVHLSDAGEFEVSSIGGFVVDRDLEAFKFKKMRNMIKRSKTKILDELNAKYFETYPIAEAPNLERENLGTLVEKDVFAEGQDQISFEDLKDAEIKRRTQKTVRQRRLEIEGLSDYRQAWDTEVDWGEGSDHEEDEEYLKKKKQTEHEDYKMIEDEDSEDEERNEIKGLLNKYKRRDELTLAELAEMENEEVEYPDQFYVPADYPGGAKARLISYRPFEKITKTPWDIKENLPLEYGQIFSIDNFSHFVNFCKMKGRTIIKNGKLSKEYVKFRKMMIGEGDHIDEKNEIADQLENLVCPSGTRIVICVENVPENVGIETTGRFLYYGDNKPSVEECVKVLQEKISQLKKVFDNFEKELTEKKEMGDFTESNTHRAEKFFIQNKMFQTELMITDLVKHGYITKPLIVSSLLPFERKLSVVHYRLKREPSYQYPVRSGDLVQIFSGFRQMYTQPIYSRKIGKVKKRNFYERFLHRQKWRYCSFYGQISYPPVPMVVATVSNPYKEFKIDENEPFVPDSQKLIARGQLTSCDSDILILKRKLLVGDFKRVAKNQARVSGMFYHPDDVRWFQSSNLLSERGLIGEIVNPVGTHGDFKAYFSKPVKSQSQACYMPLYKRAFPHWNEDLLQIQDLYVEIKKNSLPQ